MQIQNFASNKTVLDVYTFSKVKRDKLNRSSIFLSNLIELAKIHFYVKSQDSYSF